MSFFSALVQLSESNAIYSEKKIIMKKILLPLLVLLLSAGLCFSQSREERNVGSFTGIMSGGSFNVYLKKGDKEKVVIEAQSGPIDKIITEVKGDVLKIYVDDNRGVYRFRGVDIYVTFTELEAISGSGSGNVRLESPLRSNDLVLSSSGSGNLYCMEKMRSDGDTKIVNSGSGSVKIESSITAGNNIQITNSGSGGISIDEINARELSLQNSGSGSARFNGGEVDHQSVVLSGSGSLHAENLVSNTCQIRKSGSGSVYLNVKDKLSGSSSGSGNVYLKGTSARLDFSSSGSGKIKHVN